MSQKPFDPFAGGEIERVAPSTFAQREIISSSQMSDEASTAFNEGVTVDLKGPIDTDIMAQSYEVLIDRHESFRSTFSRKGDEICLQNSARGRFEIKDISELSDKEQQKYLKNLYDNIATSPMDLEEGPLIFAWLITLNAETHQLVFAAHHSICDGWSFGLLLKELAQIYSEGGVGTSLPKAPSFFDFAEQNFANQIINKDVDFWKSKFAVLPPTLDLPLDYHRPAKRTFSGARYDYSIDGEFSKKLKSASARMKTSLVNVVLSAYSVLLYRLTGNEDIVIGLPVAGQAALNKLNLAGHMVQLLPIRVELEASTKFSELLSKVKTSVLDASEHPKFTYGELIKDLAVDRSRVPLIATIFNIDQKMPELSFGEALGDVNSLPRASENFELFLNVFPKADELVIEATYSTLLFKEETIMSWLGALQHILKAVIENPEFLVGDVALSNQTELSCDEVNQTDYQCRYTSMIDAVEQSVVEHAENEALVCANRRLTYAQMWHRVNRLAAYLANAGIKDGQIVGVCCERSENLVLATLALHRLGAAYLPMDPSFPVDRLTFVYQDAGAVAVISDKLGKALLGNSVENVLDIEGEASAEQLVTVDENPQRLAYIIYTSGSTGKPKGVEISWASMINLLESMLVKPGFDRSNTLLAVTTLAFDISIVEVFLPLMVGGRIVIAQQDDLKDGDAINALIEAHQVDYLQSTPATFQLLMASAWAQNSKKTLKALCCGEPLPPKLAESLIPRVHELWNMYGPTEATVYATRKHLTDPKEQITIGRPIENTRVMVLDDRLNPLPISVPGELYIAGDNLAIAYHNRPDLTEKAFVEHPVFGRIYRTGDLAKWNTNQEIVHLGRIDDQIKIRGYRIELGEIEKAILDTGLVEMVAVILKGEESNYKLVACCKIAEGHEFSEALVKESMRKVLPGYMLPQHFVVLDKIPLTNSGKVDRKELSSRSFDLQSQNDEQGSEPQTPEELYLAKLWKDIIDIDSVYLEDNFFDLGAHSLLAAQLISQVSKDKGVQLPFNALISGTLKQIAETYLSEKAIEQNKAREPEIKKSSWLSRLIR